MCGFHQKRIDEALLTSTHNIHFRREVRKYNVDFPTNLELQSTLVISKSKGLSEILLDIHTSTYKICRIEEK